MRKAVDINLVSIYALICPETNKIVYVGKTHFSLENRLRMHLNQKRGSSLKTKWVKALKEKQLMPIIMLLETVNQCNWQYKEKYWIKELIKNGNILLNHNSGGGGGRLRLEQTKLQLFTDYLQQNGYSKNSIKNYCSCIRLFLCHFFTGEPQLKVVNSTQINNYISTISQPNTQKVAISAIKLFYKVVVNQPKKLGSIKYKYK